MVINPDVRWRIRLDTILVILSVVRLSVTNFQVSSDDTFDTRQAKICFIELTSSTDADDCLSFATLNSPLDGSIVIQPDILMAFLV